MEFIDEIQIQFSQDQLTLLNICLGFLMFSVALDIRIDDFKQLIKSPRLPVIGLVSQLIWLPILTLGLVYLMALPPSMSLGLVLVAACPGGNVSNYAVHMADGNTALSVIMTSVSTLAAVILTPLYFSLLSQFVPGAESIRQSFFVAPSDMVLTILQLIVLPLILGMALFHYAPGFTNKIRKSVRLMSVLTFLGIIVYAVLGNIENIQNYLQYIFFIVLIHNALALITGYQWARVLGLNRRDRKAISIETGIQNTGLALIIIFNFFDGLGGMAIVAAWWGIWHLIAGFGLALWWGSPQTLLLAKTT